MPGTSQQAQEDLASLFSRSLTFNPDSRSPVVPKETTRQESVIPVPTAPTQSIVYSISQHYNHSAHVARLDSQPLDNRSHSQPQRPSSEPPQSDISSTEEVLRSYGFNPAIFTPSQLQLFRTADGSQKLRLLELWSICPPNKAEDIPALAWSSTSLDQEEQMARMRYELQQNPIMSLDGTPIQSENGGWTQQGIAPETEPYMSSGYEELMRREYGRQAHDDVSRSVHSHFGNALSRNNYSRATDPVYKGSDYEIQQQQLKMAVQYGALERFRAGSMEVDAMDM
ncbi:hypothetical protein UVI_02020010 [Ustilaginoidea virens]|nr:hypothetical protein UVI_02020010 [Ustilaginoidea virens]